MRNKNSPPQKYFVGDTVIIKGSPVNCAFMWISSMDAYCGVSTVIASAKLAHDGRDWRYEVSADDRYHGWCENCFEDMICVDLPEFEAESVDSMLGLIY